MWYVYIIIYTISHQNHLFNFWESEFLWIQKAEQLNLLPTLRSSRGQHACERIQHRSVTPHGPPRSPPQTTRALRDHCTMLYFPLRVEQTWKAPLRYHRRHHIHTTNLLLKVPKLHRPASTSATWVVLPPWLAAAHPRRSLPEKGVGSGDDKLGMVNPSWGH